MFYGATVPNIYDKDILLRLLYSAALYNLPEYVGPCVNKLIKIGTTDYEIGCHLIKCYKKTDCNDDYRKLRDSALVTSMHSHSQKLMCSLAVLTGLKQISQTGYERALMAFISDYPHFTPALIELSDFYLAMGDKKKALIYMEEALISDPQLPQILTFRLVDLHYDSCDYESACKYALHIISINPNCIEAMVTVVKCLIELKKSGQNLPNLFYNLIENESDDCDMTVIKALNKSFLARIRKCNEAWGCVLKQYFSELEAQLDR